jgi:hypothetical protein
MTLQEEQQDYVGKIEGRPHSETVFHAEGGYPFPLHGKKFLFL